MSKKKKEEKIAVVIDGKDICRIVPFNPADGKYEIKMDFLGNEFDTSCYRLFSHRPIQWEINDSTHLEVTYHKGENAKPLTIHLKQKEKKEGKDTYTNLPLQRIQAPNVNQLFPMPILKLEIPSKASNKIYNPKGYHKLIKPEECNVVEIYLAHAEFDIDAFMEKLPGVHMAFLMLSFEIFATNTVITDYQKAANILPKVNPTCIMTSFPMLDDIQIIAIHYKDYLLDDRRSKINVTFIENELSEAILSMMKIEYPKVSRNGEYDCIYLGAANLKDINQPTIPLARPSIGSNNVISDAFKRNNLTSEEKEKMYCHALKLRVQLRDALTEHQQNSNEIKNKLFDKVNGFVKAIKAIEEYRENLLEDEEKWFLSCSDKGFVDILLMIAKYLEMDQCQLYARSIGRIGAEHDYYHVWLQYYDLFDIDVNCLKLSEIMHLELKEEIIVAPAEHHPVLAEYAECNDAIIKAGHERGPLKIHTFNEGAFNEIFQSNDKLLNRIYGKILLQLND